MMELAKQIQSQPTLRDGLQNLITESDENWQELSQQIEKQPVGMEFLNVFQNFLDQYLDVSYGKERLKNQPVLVLKNILEMAKALKAEADQNSIENEKMSVTRLEQKLFDAVGEDKQAEAKEILRIGRISWRLRDDDNLLLGRVESQLLRAINEGADRLRAVGRLVSETKVTTKSVGIIADALRHPEIGEVIIPFEQAKAAKIVDKQKNVKPRQLIGQPAAPGLISGKVRIIRASQDLGQFQAGEILVCDAIQPNMTHLVPLASAIIERRGGMLIHGAIIAREMGIPCVNGVPNAADILEDGELVTVDGHLGIVTVGAAEFDLEIE